MVTGARDRDNTGMDSGSKFVVVVCPWTYYTFNIRECVCDKT